LADIIGRRFGAVKWPFSKTKSIAGSLGFVIGAFVTTVALLTIYSSAGCITVDVSGNLIPILLISVLCAAVELIPIGDKHMQFDHFNYFNFSYVHFPCTMSCRGR